MGDIHKQCQSKKMLKVSEIAERLDVPTSTVYTMLNRGELPAAKYGKHWRMQAETLERVIREREDAGQWRVA